MALLAFANASDDHAGEKNEIFPSGTFHDEGHFLEDAVTSMRNWETLENKSKFLINFNINEYGLLKTSRKIKFFY